MAINNNAAEVLRRFPLRSLAGRGASARVASGPHALTAHLEPLSGTRELNPGSDYGYAIYGDYAVWGGGSHVGTGRVGEALLDEGARGREDSVALPFPATAEGEDTLRRGGRGHDRVRLLPLRERRGGPVGSGRFGDYSVKASVFGV